MCQKTCFKCGEVKPLSDFYKHKGMADGHLNKCKVCTKKDTAKYASENVDKVNGYKRKWAKTNPVKNSNSKKDWCEQNPTKRYCHNAVNNALRDGKLEKPLSCECCQIFTDALHAHHCDYTKPLDVMWLCSKCHRDWHKNNTPIEG